MEVLNILVSLLAVVIAAIAMVRTRKTNDALVELERVHAELSRKQLDLINKDEDAQKRAKISIRMSHVPPSNYTLKVENIGYAPARDITIEAAQDCEYDPLIKNDYDSKMPYPLLNSGESFILIASVPMSMTRRVFPFDVRWVNEDSSVGESKCIVS